MVERRASGGAQVGSRRVVGLLLLAAAYFLTGWLGLQLPAFGPSITLLWLPSGIAVAAAMRWGPGCWPGIALGSLAVNLMIGAPWPVALAIATGNTLGPLLAAFAARRLGMHLAFDRVHDILLLAIAATIGMLVTATVGTAALSLGGRLPEGRVTAWLLWWAGDLMGVITGAPLLLAANRAALRSVRARGVEFAAWASVSVIVVWAVFVANRGTDGPGLALAFATLPTVAWAASRFRAIGTSLALILLSIGAVYGTTVGAGPFHRANPIEGAWLVWIYFVTAAVVGWVIHAVRAAERRASEMQSVLEQALGEMPCGVLLGDEKRRITYVSDGFTRLTGYTAAELLGKSCRVLQGPETDPNTLQRLKAAMEGAGHFDGDILNFRKDGTPFWNALLISPVFDAEGARTGFVGLQRDATARVEAERAFHENRERLEATLGAIDDVIYSSTPDGNTLLFLSAPAERLYGRPVEEFIRDPMTWLNAVHPEDRPRIEAGFRQLPESGGFDHDYRIVRADGSVRWVHDRLRLVRGTDGEPTRLDGIVSDITERKRYEILGAAERAALELLASDAPLADSLARLAQGYEDAFPGACCAVMLLDDDGRSVRHRAAPSLPAAFCRALDGTPIGPEGRGCAAAANARTPTVVADIATDPAWTEHRDLALEHGLRACWAVPIVSSNDRILGLLAVYAREPRTPRPEELQALERSARHARLAVERHELLGALRESELRLATLVGNLPGMAYRCRNDPDWTMAYVSDSCEAITGYRREELEENRIVAYGDLVHPDDRDWLWAKCQASLDACTPCQNEYRIIDREGRERWVLERASGVYGADGKLQFIDGFIQDVTASHLAAQERERLEQQVLANQRLESVGTLAGGIAHEFNNRLAVILGHAELALRDVTLPGRARDGLQMIRKAGLQARDVVQQILAFSRRQPVQRRAIQLVPTVADAVAMLRTTLTPAVELTTRFADDLPDVEADPTQLQQVVLNLCINAAQAMGDRDGSVSVSTDTVTVSGSGAPPVAELKPGDYARISVIDTGPGMDAATIARIFEPFFTTKPIGVGTGLGLSVAHGIVQAHDGAITVESAPGRGSRFDVYLPAVRRAPPPPDQMDTTTASAGRGQHILFVDDQEWLVPMAQQLLEDAGYRVSGFCDPRAALDFLRVDPGQVDLVVSDYRMPGINGIELLRSVRHVRGDLPAILMSGAAEEEVRFEAIRLGAIEFVYKPNIVEELAPAIARLLHSR